MKNKTRQKVDLSIMKMMKMVAGSGQNHSSGLDVLYLAGFILKAETKEENVIKYRSNY